MDQIHRRFNTDQIRHLLRAYLDGLMDRAAVEASGEGLRERLETKNPPLPDASPVHPR